METAIQRYDTTETYVDIQGHRLSVTRIADLEALVDHIDPITFAEDERIPYWAELWPSSVALANYVCQHLSLQGQRVLELGCGLGLVGLAAAQQGGRVLCTDYEADALDFARHNARQNAYASMRFRLVDWRSPANLRRRYDCILAADVIYEARNFAPLIALLHRFLARHGMAIFAEPGRVNAVPFFALLRQYGFTYHKTLYALEWEGSHSIWMYTIRYRRHAGIATLP